MGLYLINTESIYFPQIKEYYKEIISSYDNGNYRSSMVMLYSTIICDLLLKIKELSDVYCDKKAENILEDINNKRKKANSSAWEWELIKKIWNETELLTDESYAMIESIYKLRNFSAHPALNDDYELISPTPEMTVAYIKKTLDDIFLKPSVFAQNIVDRMSNDVASKKELYLKDFDSFQVYINKVYLQRMSEKMVIQVFKAFWKFTFVKNDEKTYEKNRHINRKTLEVMLQKHGEDIIKIIKEKPNYFHVTQNSVCLAHLCALLAYFPKVFISLDHETQFQVKNFEEDDIGIIKWFLKENLDQHIIEFKSDTDILPTGLLNIFKVVCERQGEPQLFSKLLIKHYAQSDSYASTRNRFDGMTDYIEDFSADDFIQIIDAINSNKQIYEYGWQEERNNKIFKFAKPILPENFDFDKYPNFKYTKDSDTEVSELQEECEALEALSSDANEGELAF